MNPLLQTAQCLCLASRRAARTITRRFDRELRAHGLRATQFSLLALLQLKGEQTVGQLAELLGAERTTVSRNLALVEAAGFVHSRPGKDARARLVAITPAGSATLEAAFATWQRVQASLTRSMGQDAADGLRQLSGGVSLYKPPATPPVPKEETP